MSAGAARRRLAAALVAVLAAGGCDSGGHEPDADESGPVVRGAPNARPETVEMLRADLEAERHPSDGGGRAWLDEPEPAAPRVGERARLPIVYEAGPLGVAEGGALYLQISPFWSWSPLQLLDPEAPGYTTAGSEAEGLSLVPERLEASLLRVRIEGRALREGERVRIVYGAGPAGARVDAFAERGEGLFVAVDGDGDGLREQLAETPRLDVLPGPPAALVLHLPASARPGETVELVAAVLDAAANAGVAFEGELELELPEGLEGPARLAIGPGDAGRGRVPLRAHAAGIYRVLARGPDELWAESNPLVVDAEAPRVLFGDLHGHSNYSDGTGLPEDWYAYARDVAALDVAALTDHDHWGLVQLDREPERFEEIRAAVARFHEPGRFVALLGYEWTSWVFGHRHVLHFEAGGALHSSLDPATDEPEELWAALRGRAALTLAHHSAGDPIATDWSIRPDPELEPVTEIVSVHGSSEAPDAPVPVRGAIPGNFVRDVLQTGVRLGFVGSGDGHDGHPGLTHLVGPSGGLAGILAEERSRASVLEALRARRVYATNGPRIVLEVHLAGQPMGSQVPPGDATLEIIAAAPGPLERLDVVRGAEVVGRATLEGLRDVSAEVGVPALRPGEFVYVRLLQRDGGAAWSSPFFVGAD